MAKPNSTDHRNDQNTIATGGRFLAREVFEARQG